MVMGGHNYRDLRQRIQRANSRAQTHKEKERERDKRVDGWSDFAQTEPPLIRYYFAVLCCAIWTWHDLRTIPTS